MKVVSCRHVALALEAFHDNELAIDEQVAIAGHLRECQACEAEARRLAIVADVLRSLASAESQGAVLPLEGLSAAVVGQIQAERDTSLSASVGRMFEDMHLVWAGLSATMATLTCAAILSAIWFLSPPERADSLAGLLSALANPGSNQNPVSLDQRMSVPRVSDADAVPAMLAHGPTEEDLVFALAAVVTREGRIASPELLSVTHDDREVVLRLMNAVSEARFKPASLRGTPVAVNFVWLLTRTTVRGKAHS